MVEPHAVGEKWLSLRPPGDRPEQAGVAVPGIFGGSRDFAKLRCGTRNRTVTGGNR